MARGADKNPSPAMTWWLSHAPFKFSANMLRLYKPKPPESADMTMPLSRLTLCFVDVETTGMSPKPRAGGAGDGICEIGIVKCSGMTPKKSFDTLINPMRPISPAARMVNGITDRMVRHAPTFADMARDLAAFLDGSVLVAHNAPFDMAFLCEEFRRAGVEFGPRPVLDTLRIARKNFGFDSNALAFLADVLQIPAPVKHRALADAGITHGVFCSLLKRMALDEQDTLGRIAALQGGLYWPK